jgi:hypothetical protein
LASVYFLAHVINESLTAIYNFEVVRQKTAFNNVERHLNSEKVVLLSLEETHKRANILMEKREPEFKFGVVSSFHPLDTEVDQELLVTA